MHRYLELSPNLSRITDPELWLSLWPEGTTRPLGSLNFPRKRCSHDTQVSLSLIINYMVILTLETFPISPKTWCNI